LKPIEISESLTEMHKIRKHYLIFTDAGKPVYSRYGDEITLAPFFATLSAIIPKIQSYFCTTQEESKSNRLHSLTSGKFKCYFLHKGSLVYICMVNQNLKTHEGKTFQDDLRNT
jgi:vacuolar fusion protein MON1